MKISFFVTQIWNSFLLGRCERSTRHVKSNEQWSCSSTGEFFFSLLAGLNRVSTVYNFVFFAFQWETPHQLLEHVKTGESWLPPPQIYELSRLRNEPNIDKLLPFARHRGVSSPTTLYFPIQYQANDGFINCYPGDDLYPKNPNYEITEHNVKQFKDKSCDECRRNASKLHRFEEKSLADFQIWQNVNLSDNHLSAQVAQVQDSHKPKL